MSVAIENAITPSSSSGGLLNFASANAGPAQGTFAAIFAAKTTEPDSAPLASQGAAIETTVTDTTGIAGGNLQSSKVHGVKHDENDSQLADATSLLGLLLPVIPALATPVGVAFPAAANAATASHTFSPDSVAGQSLAGSTLSSSPSALPFISSSNIALNTATTSATAVMPQNTAPGSITDSSESSNDSAQPSLQPFSARVFSAASPDNNTMTPALPSGAVPISSLTAKPRIPAVEAMATQAAGQRNVVPVTSGAGVTSSPGVTSAQVVSISQTAKPAISSRASQANDAHTDPTNQSASDESEVEVSWLASPELQAVKTTSVFSQTLPAPTLTPGQTPVAKMLLAQAQPITQGFSLAPQFAWVAQDSLQSLSQGSGGANPQNSNASLTNASLDETSADQASAPRQVPPQNPVVPGAGANNATTNSAPTQFVSPLTQPVAQAGGLSAHSPVLLPMSLNSPSREIDLTQSAHNWFSASLNSASQQLRQNLPPAGNPPPHTAQTAQSAASENVFSAAVSSGLNKNTPSNTTATKSGSAASGSSAGTATASGSANKNSQTGSAQNDSNNSAAQAATAAASLPSASAPAATASATGVVDPTLRAAETGTTSAMPQHKADDGTAAAGSDSRTNLPAAAEVPVAAPPSPVQMAQMVNKAAQSEMRIGMNTSEFGNVEVRTVVHAGDVGVVIGSEKGDLRSLLANELPGITNTLQQQNLRLNQVNFHQTFAFSNPMSSGGDSQPRQFHSRNFSAQSSLPKSNGQEMGEVAEVQSNSVGGGISILA